MSRSNFRFLTCIFLFFLVSGCKPATESPDSSEFIRAMNRGKAHLENKDAPGAIRAFSEAVDHAPDSAPARRNLARAYLQAREIEPVAEVLARAIVLEVDSPANHYLSGLAHARQSEFDQAVRQYEEAVRLDPTTATLRFQLASAYQAVGDHEKASHQLKETLRLDPFHTAAHYRLAGYARKSGDRKELKYRLREVKRLRSLFSDKSRSAELLERCQYSLAEPPLRAAGSERHAATRVQGVRFLEVTSEWLPGESERTAPVIAASLLQLGKDGRYTLFAADRDGQIRLLTSEKNGALRDTTLKSTLSAGVLSSQRLISLPGNFHDSVPEGTPYDPEIHARNDLVLVGDGGVQLLEQTAAGTLDDVTSRAGLSEARGTAVEWMDYDHDGDIDLILGDERGLQLWQNGGDGQFANVSAEAGIDESKPVRDLQAADLDNDVAIDLVVARGTALQPEATQIFENQRTGTFSARPAVPGPWPASGRLLIDDLDNDGMLDTLLIGESEVLILPGSGATRVHLDLGGLQPRAAVLLDVDNNGWLDLLLAGTDAGAAKGSRLMLWSFDASDGWREVSDATGLAALSLPTVSDLLAADLDSDGDTDLTLVTSDGLRLLRNDGGEANGQLKIRLVGTKTNPGGIGTRVEVRAGKYWVARSVSALPIEIGLAGRTQLDSVYTVWTNGVVDNQIQIPAPPDTLTLIEKHVAAGSCPYLYAWSGKTFRFVTDLLGNSPLGLSLRRGQVLSADPEELVWIGDSKSFVPRDGHYVLQVTEELREVLYLDEARLIAVDHAPDVEVHPTDRLMPPPYPASEIWPLAQP
ncbi:MAG: tetratricopeptide repeat protein, partial [bacterium]|nr:tetratricopeptide repeat protein [bacterium]